MARYVLPSTPGSMAGEIGRRIGQPSASRPRPTYATPSPLPASFRLTACFGRTGTADADGFFRLRLVLADVADSAQFRAFLKAPRQGLRDLPRNALTVDQCAVIRPSSAATAVTGRSYRSSYLGGCRNICWDRGQEDQHPHSPSGSARPESPSSSPPTTTTTPAR
jgi:hypothetical protein